jgi:hypothetical protein
MARITKPLDRSLSPLSRSQVFTEADVDAGDIIMVADSLGHPGHYITIDVTGGGELSLRYNVIRSMFAPRRDVFFPMSEFYPNTADKREFICSGVAAVTVDDNEIYALQGELAINDIQLETVSGVFTIFVS